MRDVFISHSSNDMELVKSFIQLLENGIGIENIFCTSFTEYGVPAGKDFIVYIKEKLHETDIVIFLITENFLKSQFCNAELGAVWALNKKNIAILVPPISYKNMDKGVFSKIQHIMANNKKELNIHIYEYITKLFKIEKKKSFSKWESNRDNFLDIQKKFEDKKPDISNESLQNGTNFRDATEAIKKIIDEKYNNLKRRQKNNENWDQIEYAYDLVINDGNLDLLEMNFREFENSIEANFRFIWRKKLFDLVSSTNEYKIWRKLKRYEPGPPVPKGEYICTLCNEFKQFVGVGNYNVLSECDCTDINETSGAVYKRID